MAMLGSMTRQRKAMTVRRGDDSETRDARLARALRENLRKRKAQRRARYTDARHSDDRRVEDAPDRDEAAGGRSGGESRKDHGT